MAFSVLIVDDHDPYRAWARVVLEQAGYAVVGEAADGAHGLAAARRLHPDAVLLDIRLPDIDGFEVARRLASDSASPAVVLISTRDACDYGDRIKNSCARGFVPKAEFSGEALAGLLEPVSSTLRRADGGFES